MKLSTSLLSLVATGVVALPKPQSNLPAQPQQGTQQLSSSNQLQQQQWQQQPGTQTQETFVQSIGPGFNILLAVETSPKGDKAIVAWAYGRSQCVERQLVSKGLNFCGKWLEFNRVPELDPGLQATGDWEQVYVTFVGCDDRSRNGDYSGIFMAVFVPGEYEQDFSPNTQGQLGGSGGQFGQGSQIGQGGQNPQQFNPNQQLGTGSNTQQFNPQQQGQFNPNQQQQGQPASGQFNTNQMQGNQFQPNQNQQLQQNPNAQALGRPTQPNTNQFQPQQQGNFAPNQNSQLLQNGQPQPQALGRPAGQPGQQVQPNQFAPQNLQQNQPVQQGQAQPNQFVPNSNSQQSSFGSSLQQNTNNQLQPGGQPGTVQQNQFGQNNQQGGTPQSFQQNAVPQQQQPGQQLPSSQFSSNALPQTQQIQPGKPNPNKRLTPAQLSQLPKNLPIGLMQEAGLPTGDQGSSSLSQGPSSQGLQNSQIQQSGSDSGSGSDSDPIDPATGQTANTNWMGDGSGDSGNDFGSGTDVGFGGGSALDWYGWVGWYVEFYECNSDRELHGCNYEGDDNTDLTTFLSCGDYAYTADRTPNDDNDEGKSDSGKN